MKNMLTLIILFYILSGCSDDRLNIDSSDSIGIEEANRNENSLEAVKNGIYFEFADYRVFGRDIIVAGDLISDDSFVNIRNSNRFTILNNMSYMVASNDVLPLDGLYNAYIQANLVINTTLPDTDRVKQYKAEAYVGKALALFYAVNFYSASVASGKYQEYGVPVFSDNYDPRIKYPRSTIPEVYTEIENNLLKALELFQEEPVTKQFFGPTAAKLLLSRVYLYQQKWREAYNYALEVENSAGGKFQFADMTNYENYFASILPDELETVFEIGYSENNSPQLNHVAAIYSRDGVYRQNEFRESLYNLYKSTDVRKKLFIYDNTNLGGNQVRGYFTTKYSSAAEHSQSIKILRMAEAKLNKIEALYHLGNYTQALSELNAFAATRGSYTYSSTGARLLEDILKERRLEFVAEGHRFFDLKRNMLPIYKDSNCNGQNCYVEPTHRLFVFPMPQWEMINNPLMMQYPEWE